MKQLYMKHLKRINESQSSNLAKASFCNMLQVVCQDIRTKYYNRGLKKQYETILLNGYYDLKDSKFERDDLYEIVDFDSENSLLPGDYELENIEADFDDISIDLFLPLDECTVNVIVSKEDCYFLTFDSDNSDKLLFIYSMNDNDFITSE